MKKHPFIDFRQALSFVFPLNSALSGLYTSLLPAMLCAFLLVFSHSAKACSPLNTPWAASQSFSGPFLLLDVQNTSSWLNCPNEIVVEIACDSEPFSGLATASFTSPPQTFTATPYAYPTMSINISSLCPGSAYKFRIREQNQGGWAFSNWSSVGTFTTPGVFTQPSVTPVANPNPVCPNQTVQLGANVINGCGNGAYNYTWAPANIISNPNIASPTATIQAATVFTVWVSGGPLGCWITSNTVAVNINNSAPVAGQAVATPTSVCAGVSSMINLNNSNGLIQWQSATSQNGPFTNIPGANSLSYGTGALLTTTWFQAVLSSCVGQTVVGAPVAVLVKPLPTATVVGDTTVCEGSQLVLQASGGVQYQWMGPNNFLSSTQYAFVNNVSMPAAGFYTLQVTGANGCVRARVVNVLVEGRPSLTVSGSTVCTTDTVQMMANSNVNSFSWTGPNNFTSNQQNPVIFNPQVNHSGFYTVTVVDADGCSSTAVPHVTVIPVGQPTILATPACQGTTLTFTAQGGSAFWWKGPNGFLSNSQIPVINNVSVGADGMYTLTVLMGQCYSSVTKSITVYPVPQVNILDPGPLCETKTALLIAQGSSNIVSFDWTGPSNYAASGPTVSIGNAAKSNAGVYTVDVVDIHGCVNAANIAVPVLSNPLLVATGATVCLFEPAEIKATGADTYEWYGPNSFNSNSDKVKIAKVLSAGDYTVTGTAVNGCTAVAVVNIFPLTLPTPSVDHTSLRICRNSLASFEGFGGDYYEWRGPGDWYYIGKTMTLNATSVGHAGTFTVTVRDLQGCKASTTSELIVDELPEGSLVGNFEACVPFCGEYTFAPMSPSITTEWKLNNKNFKAESFRYCFDTPGEYIIKGSLKDKKTTCVNSSTYAVTVFPKPVADFEFTPEKPIEGMDEVTFINKTSGEQQKKWNWYIMSNTGPKSQNENTSYAFLEPGMFPVGMVVQNGYGCSDSVVKYIEVQHDFNVFVPNVFTPNGDQLNDLFSPVCRGVRDYQFVIYNRWGEIVFQTSDQKKGWDGSFKGEACPNDNYTWQLSISGFRGEQKSMNGYLSLQR